MPYLLVAKRRLILIVLGLVAGCLAAWFGNQWIRDQREQALVKQCLQDQRAGHWKELRSHAEELTSLQPQSASAWTYRATAAQQMGQFDEAVLCLSRVPESDPKSLPALITKSELEFGFLNRPFDGMETCEKILARDRRVREAHRQLIEFFAVTHQRQKLFEQIRMAIESNRETPSAYVFLFQYDVMQIPLAMQAATKWLASSPDSELLLVARALHLPEIDAGTDATSTMKRKIVDELLARFPRNLELLVYKMESAVRADSPGLVQKWHSQLPAEFESDGRVQRIQGWLALNQGNFLQARDFLETALKRHPLDWQARTWLVEVVRKQGSTADAERQEMLVLQAQRIRDALSKVDSIESLSQLVTVELRDYAAACGDRQVAEGLTRRLGGN